MEIYLKKGEPVKRDELNALLFNTKIYDGGFYHLERCSIPSRGELMVGKEGVTALFANSSDEYVFIERGEYMEVVINNNIGIYPSFALNDVQMKAPLKGVLFDLDGTCVKSEKFWIAVILKSVNIERQRANMPPLERFEREELPYISGKTVPEHLLYCIERYAPHSTLDQMQMVYTEIAEEYMVRLNNNELDIEAFQPADGLKEMFTMLKRSGVKIGIVTSGLYYKAMPELEQAMDSMELGDATQYFDAILTSGTLAKKGECGTMGNAIAKPWPNIYFEAAQVIGFTMDQRHHFVGVGDSSSDIGSLRFMGTPVIGVGDGNIERAGVKSMCTEFVEDLHGVIALLKLYI